eukprot:GHVL01012357.1.p1 GENE.GHVL01012357.1~~GHVL01012357.1.p1  ORF type:complete len:278 (+),score=94.51 GHVL01012357.1:25-858(+)
MIVDLEKGINISTCPSNPRICYPNKYCIPYSIYNIYNNDIYNNIINITNWPCISKEINYSNDGTCIITGHIIQKTHSHAGTHADTPYHFMKEEDNIINYNDIQYNGICCIINISYIRNNIDIYNPITKEELINIDINWSNIHRLLFRTYIKTPTEWSSNFAHLSIDAAKWLTELPNLVLVGLDTPSVDSCDAQIHISSHYILYKRGIAILEGLDFDNIKRNERQEEEESEKIEKKNEREKNETNNDKIVIYGKMWTVWIPTQQFKDARGCSVFFFKD